jgi:hypothetical protein
MDELGVAASSLTTNRRSKYRARLVLFDPLLPYLGKTDVYKDSEVRQALMPLGEMLQRRRAAGVGLRHWLKSRAERNAITAGLGSVGLSAVARSVLAVARHPTEDGKYCLASSKNNLGRKPDTLTYSIRETPEEVNRIQWGGPAPFSADDLVASSNGTDRTALSDAVDFLKEALRPGCSRPARELEAEAREAAGITKSTLARAARSLKIRSAKAGLSAGWIWTRDQGRPEAIPDPAEVER